MTLWMLWSVLFAAFVGIAAVAVERAADGFGAPRRHIWMAALLISAFVPALLAIRRAEITMMQPAAPAPVEAIAQHADLPAASSGPAAAPTPPVVSRQVQASRFSVSKAVVDRSALVLWIVASCIMATVFGRSVVQLHRQRRAWIAATVADHHVLLSADDGPAVVGFAHPSIVLPRWALGLDRRAQEMMLRHESEHIRAGDPRMLLTAGLLLVALPWNIGMWWLVRRLRMAMELDCDARVIRAVGASREYGLMLLAVGERHTTMFPLASSLASARPLLERRIDAMSLPRPRRPLRAALPFIAVALVATTAATRAPRPAPLRAPLIKVQQATMVAQTAPSAPVKPVAQPTPTRTTQQTATAQRPATAAATPARTTATALPATPSLVITTVPEAPQAPVAVPAPRRNPDRAKIAAYAKQYAATVVSGDSAAEYIVMVFDATDRYLWSTSGKGNLSIEVAGDTRTPRERAIYNRENSAEFVGATLAGGRGRGGGGAAGGASDVITGKVAGRVIDRSATRDSFFQIMPRTAGGGRGGDSLVLDYLRAIGDSGRLQAKIVNRPPGSDTGRYAFFSRDSLGSNAMGSARGGGGGGRGGSTADTLPGTYKVGWAGTRNGPLVNQASGLQEPRPGESGIQGLLSKSVALAETYRFGPGELAPQMLSILVLHLTPGTTWKGR